MARYTRSTRRERRVEDRTSGSILLPRVLELLRHATHARRDPLELPEDGARALAEAGTVELTGRLARIGDLSTRYFALIVLAAAGLAMARPGTFLFAIPHIPTLLGVIMLGMGTTLTAADFARILSFPRQVLIGTAAQFGIMPFVGWSLAVTLGLPPEIAVGVILVGACPGGTASNVITMMARGDVALSVTMTGVSTLLAPFLTPALIWLLAGRWLDVPAGDLFVSTLRIVLAPVLLGLLARHLFAEAVRRISAALPAVSVAAIALIVGAVVGNSRATLLTSGISVLLAVILHNGAGLGLGWAAARLTGLAEEQRRAVSIEVGMQNSGLAAALATAHLNPLAALPAAIFSVWHNVSGPLLATYFARREAAPAPETTAPAGAD